MCRNFCAKDYLNETIPEYTKLNNLYLDETPEVISTLNIYEKILIQLAKVYQTIVRLETKQRFTKHKGIPALKGCAIHLPLTTQATNNYVSESLPNYSILNIIVESIPTKNNIIWSQLVNLKKVYAALNYLTQYNHLYTHKNNDTKQYRVI